MRWTGVPSRVHKDESNAILKNYAYFFLSPCDRIVENNNETEEQLLYRTCDEMDRSGCRPGMTVTSNYL